MRVVIDRFEEDFAVVEISEGETALISRRLLPDAIEGDFVNIDIDHESTEERREEVTSLFDRLKKRHNDNG